MKMKLKYMLRMYIEKYVPIAQMCWKSSVHDD